MLPLSTTNDTFHLLLLQASKIQSFQCPVPIISNWGVGVGLIGPRGVEWDLGKPTYHRYRSWRGRLGWGCGSGRWCCSLSTRPCPPPSAVGSHQRAVPRPPPPGTSPAPHGERTRSHPAPRYAPAPWKYRYIPHDNIHEIITWKWPNQTQCG